MLRQRQFRAQPRPQQPSQNEGTHHSLMEWYRQSRSNYFFVDSSTLQEAYNSKHNCYRLSIVYLSYGKGELPQVADGEYELEFFANFCHQRTKFVAAPYQSQRSSCLFKSRTFVFKTPLLIYYHSLRLKDVMLFLECQLIDQELGKIRLGYCEINPYEERLGQTGVHIMRGWPLDTKEKPIAVGTCYHTLEVGSKGLANIKQLVPAMMLVDATTKIPCSKGGHLPVDKKAIELEPSTTIQIDIVQVDASQPLRIGHLAAKRLISKLSRDSPGDPQVEFTLKLGYHNSWTFVKEYSLPLKVDEKNEWLVVTGSPIEVNVCNIKTSFLVAVLVCRCKAAEGPHTKLLPSTITTTPLCWFVVPFELYRDTSLVETKSMNSPFEGYSSFQCETPVKLTCRIKHANHHSFRHLRENAGPGEADSTPDLWSSLNATLTRASEWKTFFRSEKQSSLDDIHTQNRRLVMQQKKMEKLLSQKLARPKMRPSGINQYSKVDAIPTSLFPSKHYVGKKIVSTLAIESFLPYFQRLNGSASSECYFVPRLLTLRLFVLDMEVKTKLLELPPEVKFGEPSVITKKEFYAGDSLHSGQTVSLELDIRNEKEFERLLINCLIVIVQDSQSHIVFSKGRCSIQNLMDIGRPIRFRVDLYDIEAKELRGGLCFDGSSHLQQLGRNRVVSQKPLPPSLIAMQLPEQSRLESRISAFKASQGRGDIEKSSDEAELQLIRKYKEDNVRRLARRTAERATYDDASVLRVRPCQPSFFVWDYVNDEGSLNNDYKLVIDDSDSPILSVEQLTLVKNKKDFEQACRLLAIPAEDYVEADYTKNEFYLKNGQRVRLILKYLTYRVPSSDKNIESHEIKLSLHRNTILCLEKRILIEPVNPEISDVMVFYRLAEEVVEIDIDSEFTNRFASNHFVSVLHSSTCKWFKSRMVLSLNCDGPAHKQFLLAVYRDKSRLQLLTLCKVLLYLCQGLQKTIKLGESLPYSLRLRSDKLRIARLESSHPQLVRWQTPIVSVASTQSAHGLVMVPQQPGGYTVVLSAVDHDSNELLEIAVVVLEVVLLENIHRLLHSVPICTYFRSDITVENPQGRQCEMQLRCSNPKLQLPQSFVLEAHATRRVPIGLAPQVDRDQVIAYIFVYSDGRLLIDSYELIVRYV